MKRILLTGAGGFVGHHTLEHLLVETDWEVVCTDSFRHRGKTDRLREVLDSHPDEASRVTVLTHDLRAPFTSQFTRAAGNIDAIISMASESHVDRSITDPRDFIENNVQLVLSLLDMQRTFYPDAVFLQVSTDEVYGPAPDDTLHQEFDPIKPSNPYSASKAAQEAICFSYWRTFGVPLIMTNTMNIIGERQDPEKFIPMTLAKVLAGEEVTIHASASGQPGSRFYLHARNQADALIFLLYAAFQGLLDGRYLEGTDTVEALKYDHDVDVPPRYHVVGEREVNNLEMAHAIAAAADSPLKYELVDFHSSRPGHDLRYALDGSKLAELGWTPPMPLMESLEKTIRWTLENPRWLVD